MQPQSESTQQTLQVRTLAWAPANALANALAQARRARAQVVTEARARGVAAPALVQVLAHAEAEALVLAAKVETQAKAHTVTYGEALADSELMKIIHSIEPKYHRGLARVLWRHSQHRWFIQIIAPITRLPQELLEQILLILISKVIGSHLISMRVSKLWYTIVNGIWASLNLGTRTPRDDVTRKLERNQWLLDVVVDTELDRGDFDPPEGAYQAIFAAIEATPRWRSLLIESLPSQADLPEHMVNHGLRQCSDADMSRLGTFTIKRPCEMSPLLQRLLRILGTTVSGELTTVDINSPNVISFLAPTYPSIFHSIKVLSLDTPLLPDPVDLLPHLYQLESFTASHLSLPTYPNDVDIPFVHTLRHLSLRAVSIQWMSGRTFHALESCTLLFPRHQRVLHTFSTTLPNCDTLTFHGYPLDILIGVSARNLTHLSVTCSCSDKPLGSRQLVRFSSRALRENHLTPRILNISFEAMSRAWTKAFPFMSNLEELVIHNAQPSSLGVKVLQSLVIHPVQSNNLSTTATHGGQYTLVCPSLRRFGLRYRRWLRPTEAFDLIPEFMSIIRSRQQSQLSLQSFRIWRSSHQKDPLELIEGSQMSLKGFECLADDSAIKGGSLLEMIASRLLENLFKATEKSSTTCRNCHDDNFVEQ